MPTYKKKPNFYDTQIGMETKKILQSMTTDAAFNTEPSYSANLEIHPNHKVSFVDKHMNYMQTHPATDPKHYIANLRLITRIR